VLKPVETATGESQMPETLRRQEEEARAWGDEGPQGLTSPWEVEERLVSELNRLALLGAANASTAFMIRRRLAVRRVRLIEKSADRIARDLLFVAESAGSQSARDESAQRIASRARVPSGRCDRWRLNDLEDALSCFGRVR
jgi:hypothetical protein